MSLSNLQLSDFRADIGDQTDPYAFSDDELNRLFARVSSDYDAAVVLAYDQLLANAAKFYDYVSGFTRQEQDSIFDHLRKVRDMKKTELSGASQLRIVGITIVPPNKADSPDA